MDKIYDMELHETVYPNTKNIDFSITKVPGGWIYRFSQPSFSSGGIANFVCDSVFVPSNHEFLKRGDLVEEPTPEICPHCDGSGEGKTMVVCPVCKGSGEIK